MKQTKSIPEVKQELVPLLAWEVELYDHRCICFATTKERAQWIAVMCWWDAYGQRKGEWPRAKAFRAVRFDKSRLAIESRQQAWTLEYVENSSNR